MAPNEQQLNSSSAGPEEELGDEERWTLRDRLNTFNVWLRETIEEYWFSLATTLIVGAAVGVWGLFLPTASVDSARWTLSALVQGTAAILGTTFVGLTFISNEAERSLERLRVLRRGYVKTLSDLRHAASELRADTLHQYQISDLERMRRLLVDKIKSGEFHYKDGLLDFTDYDPHIDHLQDISALCMAVTTMVLPGAQEETRARIESDLRSVGVTDQIHVDLYLRESEIKSDPFYFFDVLTDIFSITNLVAPNIDERCGQLLDEIWDRTEQDNVLGLLRRVRRMRQLRGWLFKSTIIVLIGAIAWGLVVLSGYDASTSKVALAGPVALGLLGTHLVALIIGRILTTE